MPKRPKIDTLCIGRPDAGAGLALLQQVKAGSLSLREPQQRELQQEHQLGSCHVKFEAAL